MYSFWLGLAITLLPQVAFWAGSIVMVHLSGRREVRKRMKELPKRDQKPLNQRLGGYDLSAVQRLWGALAAPPLGSKGHTLLESERLALRLDLLFPLLYGSAFAVSLLLAWQSRHATAAPGWLFVPVVICVLADWTENTVQLKQLKLFQGDPSSLQESWIRVASAATRIKLLFFTVCSLLIPAMLLGWVK